MRRPAKITLQVSAGIAILTAAAMLAGVLVFRSGWFHERVRQRFIYEIESATNTHVDFGNFTFDWTHLTASAGPVVLHGRESASDPPLLAIRSVSLGLRIISMLERKFDLASLRIDQPVAHVFFFPDGSTNIPPRRPSDWVQNLFDVSIGRYEITNGLIDYDDRQIPLNLHGENLEAAMSYDARGF